MPESNQVQTTEDLPFGAFVSTFCGYEPFRCSTDGSEPYVTTLHYHCGAEEWSDLRRKYDNSETVVTSIKLFVDTVRRYQQLGATAESKGGILTLG